MATDKPRWHYRFDNYKRAFVLLREVAELMEERDLSQLEKEAMIQRFEFTWELAWKLLKDYLQDSGIVLDTITPASVIRAAYAARIIDSADTWMRALDARNKMAHTYDFRAFELVIAAVNAEYLAIFYTLYIQMFERVIAVPNA